MNSELLFENIDQYIRLGEVEKEFFLSVLIPRPFKQGEIIVQNGDPAKYVMFVNEGYLMTYYADQAGAEHVIHFTGEGWWCGDFYSFSENPVTPYTTKALSNGELLLLPRLAQNQLLNEHPWFGRYFRIIFHRALMRQQLRYIESCSTSAEDRYLSFIKAYPGIFRDVPQKYIASYLGITPEFLSKIRNKLSKVA
jgi:CRP-like cAMP-binding protein